MTDPEGVTDPEDVERDEWLDPARRDPEAPDADAAEQATPANPADVEELPAIVPLEVDEADAQEQTRLVDIDEDYR